MAPILAKVRTNEQVVNLLQYVGEIHGVAYSKIIDHPNTSLYTNHGAMLAVCNYMNIFIQEREGKYMYTT